MAKPKKKPEAAPVEEKPEADNSPKLSAAERLYRQQSPRFPDE